MKDWYNSTYLTCFMNVFLFFILVFKLLGFCNVFVECGAHTKAIIEFISSLAVIRYFQGGFSDKKLLIFQTF